MSTTTVNSRISIAPAASLNEPLIGDQLTRFFVRTPVQPLVSKKAVWSGRIMSFLPVIFLVLDGVMKLMNITAVAEAEAQLGIPQNLSLTIGIIELVCVLIYVVPQSSIVGAILLTGFLGGATAIQLRVGNPLFSHLLFPAYVGVFLWSGLYLRDERLRRLIGN